MGPSLIRFGSSCLCACAFVCVCVCVCSCVCLCNLSSVVEEILEIRHVTRGTILLLGRD